MKNLLAKVLLGLFGYFFLVVSPVSAAGSGVDHAVLNQSLLFIVILLIVAKLGGIIEKIGMPAILGELAAGIFLSALGYYGWHTVANIRQDTIIAFLSQLGAIILLFEIGLEANIKKLLSVGINSLLVAAGGVIAPFVLGYFVIGPLALPNAPQTTHLFLGASLVATSISIGVLVLKDLGLTKSRAFQTFLGATITDDILGLIILAIVSSIVTGGTVTPSFVAVMTLKSIGFLAIAIILGQLCAKKLSQLFSKIHTGTGMKLSVALGFAFSYAYVATLFGLEPIIGAFAAGLVLDAVHFNFFDKPTIIASLESIINKSKKVKNDLVAITSHHAHTHIEDMTHSISILFVPIFFAYTGLQIDFELLLDPSLYLLVFLGGSLAVLGKAVAGIAAKGTIYEKLLVGLAMVPRGEVGLIFAAVGKNIGVLNDRAFALVVLIAIFTTFVSAPLIKVVANKYRQEKST